MPKKELPRNIPVCRTVGDLLKELEKLPRTLAIKQGFGNGVKPVVYNINCIWSKPQLEFNENVELTGAEPASSAEHPR